MEWIGKERMEVLDCAHHLRGDRLSHCLQKSVYRSSVIVDQFEASVVCDTDDVHEPTRQDMHAYWRQHSKEASVKEMMLDSNAEELGKEEIPEILSMVPDCAGMDVLELGAGIGCVLTFFCIVVPWVCTLYVVIHS